MSVIGPTCPLCEQRDCKSAQGSLSGGTLPVIGVAVAWLAINWAASRIFGTSGVILSVSAAVSGISLFYLLMRRFERGFICDNCGNRFHTDLASAPRRDYRSLRKDDGENAESSLK